MFCGILTNIKENLLRILSYIGDNMGHICLILLQIYGFVARFRYIYYLHRPNISLGGFEIVSDLSNVIAGMSNKKKGLRASVLVALDLKIQNKSCLLIFVSRAVNSHFF